tara:strand:- start:266 stop:727 length:462 start_codon:yes stop_codon:yes gene_type:complete
MEQQGLVVGQVHSGQQVVVIQKQSALPMVIGIIFCIFQIFGFIGAIFLMGIGVAFGIEGDEVWTAFGVIIAIIGALLFIISVIGVWAGVLIAKNRKLGVHIAWGLIGASVALTIVGSVLGELPINYVNIGCNGFCALFVGLPLLISSVSQQME